MYQIGVIVLGAGELPQRFESFDAHPYQAVQRLDGTWSVSIPDLLNSETFDVVIREIERLNLTVWSSHFGVDDSLGRFERETMDYRAPDVVGFEVTGDHFQQLTNPPEDFDPYTSPPCRGILRLGRDVIVNERPTGLLAWAGHRLIASEIMHEWMFRHGCDLRADADVICKGKVIHKWTPMHEKLSVECLDDSFRHGVECLACHAPIASDMGVYFGRSIPQHTLGYDLTGWDHFGRSRILIASPDIAESLESSFGVDAAYGVFPIFDANGPTAQSIRDVLHRLTPYKGMHPLWKQQS